MGPSGASIDARRVNPVRFDNFPASKGLNSNSRKTAACAVSARFDRRFAGCTVGAGQIPGRRHGPEPLRRFFCACNLGAPSYRPLAVRSRPQDAENRPNRCTKRHTCAAHAPPAHDYLPVLVRSCPKAYDSSGQSCTGPALRRIRGKRRRGVLPAPTRRLPQHH